MSVNEKMTLLADAVRAKCGTTGPLSIDGMTEAVNSITVGSGIDTSDATAYDAYILSPYTAYARGGKITGTMENKGNVDQELTPRNSSVLHSGGYFNGVNVRVDTSVDRTFTPSKERQGFDGYDEGKFLVRVTVEPIPDEYITTSDATAKASDISAGETAYVKGELVTGTLEDVTAVIDGATVTIPAGRIREEQTLTVQTGSVSLEKNTVTVTEGYVEEQTLTVQAGSVSLEKDIITVAEGYVEEQTLTVPAGSVVIDKTVNKAIVSEGYVKPQEIPLPGGFSLVKVTNYHPAREGISEPHTVTFSGLGTVESQYGGDPVDFSDVNGDYVVTEDTKYKKGLARVYKQQGGKYYLCGYDPSDMDWAEYSAHWYISETIGGYGYGAKMSVYSSSELHTGTVNWSNENIGEFPVTTTVAVRDYPALTETSLAQSVTAFDPETAEWTEGGAVDISSYSITPQTNGIYFTQGGKLIGQLIDRELQIPEDGLVRRFKAVDGHFVDDIWGTEMMPTGDISYDELGFHGNNPAPMAKTIGSYLEAKNTLSALHEMTFNIFVKPMYTPGRRTVWKIAGEGSDQYCDGLLDFWLFDNNSVRFGALSSSAIDSAIPYNLGKWNMFTITASFVDWIDPKDGIHRMRERHVKAYVNGNAAGVHDKVWADSEYGTSLHTVPTDTMRFFANMNYSSESWIGQIDEACVWGRILTDEEIADMAKGLEDFNWDIPVKPYVQEQPVLYAPLADASKYCPSGQTIHINNVGNTESLSERGFFRNGAFWNYRTNDSGSLEYDMVCIGQNYSSLYTSGSFTVCVDVYVEGYRDGVNWQNYDCESNIISSNPTRADGIALYSKKGSSSLFMRFKAIDGGTVPYNTWTTLIARSDAGKVDLFAGAVKGGYGTVTDHHPFSGYADFSGPYDTFKCAIRNIRLYNRAITDEEVAELSGITESE